MHNAQQVAKLAHLLLPVVVIFHAVLMPIIDLQEALHANALQGILCMPLMGFAILAHHVVLELIVLCLYMVLVIQFLHQWDAKQRLHLQMLSITQQRVRTYAMCWVDMWGIQQHQHRA